MFSATATPATSTGCAGPGRRHAQLRRHPSLAAQLHRAGQRLDPGHHRQLHRLLGQRAEPGEPVRARPPHLGRVSRGLPAPCARPARAGRYAKKHDPFAYDDAIAASPTRCRHRVPLSRLAADIRRDRLPDFALITPDLCDDTHDCPIATGDAFLARVVPGLLPALGPHGFLVITYDEGTTDQGCCGGSAGGRIATIVTGPDVRRGAAMARPIDHYGVLATIEDAFGLPHLGAAADPRHGNLAPLFGGGRTPRLSTAR